MPERIYFDLVPADFPDFFDGWGDNQFTRNLKDGLLSAIERCFVNALGERVLQVNPSKYMHFDCLERSRSKSISIKQIVESVGFSDNEADAVWAALLTK